MIDDLIRTAMITALKTGASDIHLSTQTGLHFRHQGSIVDSELEPHQREQLCVLTCPKKGKDALMQGLLNLVATVDEDGRPDHSHLWDGLGMHVKMLSNRERVTDFDDTLRLGELGNWRLNIYPSDLNGLNVSLRSLPAVIPTLKSLLAEPLYARLHSPLATAMRNKQGLFLVTGSTGSGKSSTLAALIDMINSEQNAKINTIEDPIEFRHKPKRSIIHHRQVGVDVGSFDAGLIGAMRQDPDIILLGELRDLETIGRALTAAETGHLVLATLHSRNVAATISRLVDVFPANRQPLVRAQLASSLIGIMSQELVATDAAETLGGRVMIPEVALLSSDAGGVRSPIHAGRFNEITQNLELIKSTPSTLYLSRERSLQILKEMGYL